MKKIEINIKDENKIKMFLFDINGTINELPQIENIKIKKINSFFEIEFLFEDKKTEKHFLEKLLLTEKYINIIITKLIKKTIENKNNDEKNLKIHGLNLSLNLEKENIHNISFFNKIENQYLIELTKAINKNKLVEFINKLD